jgi:hypothetical protein
MPVIPAIVALSFASAAEAKCGCIDTTITSAAMAPSLCKDVIDSTLSS